MAAEVAPAAHVTEIADRVYRIATEYPELANLPLYLYLVQGRDDCVLIDTGVPSTYERSIGPALARIGIPSSEIRWVLNTHGHPDHMGGNATLIAASGAKLAVPVGDVPWVEDHERHWRELWAAYPGALAFDAEMKASILRDFCGQNTRVDRMLRDGDVIELGNRSIRVVVTGAHSPDHSCYFVEDAGLLCTGDVVQGRGLPELRGGNRLAPLYTDAAAYVTAMRRLLGMGVRTLAPAHLDPASGDAATALLTSSIGYTEDVEALVRRLVADAPDAVETASVARAIASELGPFAGATIQTVAVADAHLRGLAAAGLLVPAWRSRGAS